MTYSQAGETTKNFEGESMNKSDLIEELSKDTVLTKNKAEEVVNTVFNDMANSLARGDRVEPDKKARRLLIQKDTVFNNIITIM